MHSNECRVQLDNKTCQSHMVSALKILVGNAGSERITEILNFLIQHDKVLNKVHLDKKYKDLTKNHISWG